MLNEALYTLEKSTIREFTQLAKATPGCISLTIGEPDFDTPKEIEKEVETAFEQHETHYIPNAGTDALRTGIARFENHRLGTNYTKDNVLVTAGAEEALFLAFFSVLNPGDEVIIPIPAFSVYKQIVKLCRAVPVFLDTAKDGFQITKENLQSSLTPKTKAIILNTPNNPTGVILSQDSLQNVHDAVKGKEIYVLADDVYQQLVFDSDCHSILEYHDMPEQLLLIQSFSKPYAMTGWRMGYLCADASIVVPMILVHQAAVCSTPAPFQRAALKALAYDPTDMIRFYKERRDIVLSALADMHLPVTKPEGAFYAFPCIEKTGLTSQEFALDLLQEEKVAVTPGIAFGKEGYVRIAYCVDPDDLKEAMRRMTHFMEKWND